MDNLPQLCAECRDAVFKGLACCLSLVKPSHLVAAPIAHQARAGSCPALKPVSAPQGLGRLQQPEWLRPRWARALQLIALGALPLLSFLSPYPPSLSSWSAIVINFYLESSRPAPLNSPRVGRLGGCSSLSRMNWDTRSWGK